MATAAILLLAAMACGHPGCQRRRAAQDRGQSSSRQATLLSEGWRFLPSNDFRHGERIDLDDNGWQAVEVPHAWPSTRPMPYQRAWYRARVRIPRERGSGRMFLAFDGVSTIADVYVNGVLIGHHRGAYTRFVLDATRAFVPGEENLVAVRVSNDPKETEDCLPSGSATQHYRVFGGIHRKVWLLTTANCHIDPTDHGSPGLALLAHSVDQDAARFDVRVRLANAERVARRLELRLDLRDPTGSHAWSDTRELELAPGGRTDVIVEGGVHRPRLWSPGHPQLYVLQADLLCHGRLTDSMRIRTGLRDFRFEGDRFLLNGEPLLLRGVGTHEETERHRSAVSDDEIRRDFEELAQLGANMVRLAHYPHSELAYDLADAMGVLVWAENGNSNSAKAGETGERITREMVRQNRHHPSIVVWGVGNETDYRGVDRYSAVVKAEDPVRLIAYASNTGARPRKRDLSFITHNVYRGWYRGQPWEWEPRALTARLISECGAGSMITNHTDYKRAYRVVDVFEPEEYRQLVAEAQFALVFGEARERIPMFLLWLLRDFAIDKYKGVINTKGLLTRGGLRKDAFCLYQCWLRPELPVVHITSKTCFLRRDLSANGIKAYSNRQTLRLLLNGQDAGRRKNGDYRHSNGRIVPHVFFWNTPLQEGRNDLRVTDDAGHADQAVVYRYQPGSSESTLAGAAVQNLRSSNPDNPAYFMAMPVQAEWPFYYEFDGTADNTFAEIPQALQGASWVSTRRLSKPGMRTSLSFEIDPSGLGADVFVLYTDTGEAPAAWLAAGFAQTQIRGQWRDDSLQLVPFRALHRLVSRGAEVVVPGATMDYVVLVQPKLSGSRG